MKALLSKTAGLDGLKLCEAPDPEPGPKQVLIQVKAFGVNFPDLLMIEDRYQFKPPRPFAPGGEFSGVVAWAVKLERIWGTLSDSELRVAARRVKSSNWLALVTSTSGSAVY